MSMSAEQERRETRMLERALEYLQLGYPIFPVCSPKMGLHQHRGQPCKNVGKTPLIAWQAFQTRLPTIDEVRTWWDRWPLANIGMVTGKLSGVVVLDADSGDAKKTAMEKGGLDRTPAVFTGKSGGIHYWLAHPGEDVSNFARKLPGLDFRGDGGYVLVPPSAHVSGAVYRWVDGTVGMTPAPVPSWLMDLLHDKPGGSESTSDDHAPLDLGSFVAGIPEGKRDDAMWRLASKLRNDNIPRQYAEAMMRQAARACRPAFDEDVALEKVARAYRLYEPEQTFRVTKDAAGLGSVPVNEYPIQTFADLLNMRPDGAACIIEGLLWRGRCHWIFSDPGTGKTLFLFAALLHIAAGQPFCERDVQQGAALIIEEDSPLSVLAEYGANLADIYELPDDLPVYVNKLTGLRLTDQSGYQTLVSTVESCPQKPSVVLLDASERLVPSDRYTTRELDWLARFIQWCLSEDITIMIIDHTTKERPKKGEAPIDPMKRLFGARAKSSISDIMVYFDGGISKGTIRVSFEKFRGEYPPNYNILFDAADGFSIKADRAVPKSPAEQAVLRFFNNNAAEGYTVQEIETATGLKRRTLERVLTIFTQRGWVIASGSTRSRTYRSNPAVGGLFG